MDEATEQAQKWMSHGSFHMHTKELKKKGTLSNIRNVDGRKSEMCTGIWK